jgi:hypothetical protein
MANGTTPSCRDEQKLFVSYDTYFVPSAKLLEFGDRLYQQCRAGESRRGLWTLFRSAFYLIAFDNWEALLHYHLRETAAGP